MTSELLTRAAKRSPPRLLPDRLALGYLVAYVALDQFSYLYPVAPLAITVWNPPPGLSVALLLYGGLRYAPALPVAALAADVIVRGLPHSPALALGSALILSGGYALLATFLLRVAEIDRALRRVRDVAWLAGAAIPATGLVALAYVGLHVAGGLVAQEDLGRYVLRLWTGDAIGVVVTAPFALSAASRAEHPWPSGRPGLPEVLLQLAGLGAALGLVFWWAHPAEATLFYVLFPPVIWVVLRHGLLGATAAILAVQVVLILVLWIRRTPVETVLQFQVLMLVLAGSALLLGAAVGERTRATAALSERQEELGRALRLAAAGEMASALAHELNQPLSAIVSFAKASRLLLAGGDRDRLAQTLERVVGEAVRASEVVRRLRDFFRVGAFRLEPLSVADLLRAGAEAARIRASRHQVSIDLRCPEPAPTVVGDRVQLEIVLHNLIGNSIDAISHAGSPRREVSLVALQRPGEVEIRVEDTGPGVPADLVPRLFSPFTTSKVEGMGLGLAIARYVVEAHGGRLRAEERAAGAAFCLTLPLDGARPQA